MAGERDIDRVKKRQSRLREAFLDLANGFVTVRMDFLRRTGAQPPDERPKKTETS